MFRKESSVFNFGNLMNIVLRLEIWPGFAVAIEEREGGLMVCLDSSHRVLRTETVYEYLYDFSKFLNVLLREVSVSSDVMTLFGSFQGAPQRIQR
jgi:hypothetical protein